MLGGFWKPAIACWICWSLAGAGTAWGLPWGGGALPASPKGSPSSQPGSGAPEGALIPSLSKLPRFDARGVGSSDALMSLWAVLGYKHRQRS